MSVTLLDLEDLLALADDLDVLQVRDLGLLASAAQRPATSHWMCERGVSG